MYGTNSSYFIASLPYRSDSGDIVHANVGGTHMVILNSVDVVTDLLQGRGTIYSDRPYLYVLGELVGLNKTLPFMNEGSKLKESRRFFSQEIGSKQTLARFESMMHSRIKRFAGQLLTNPEAQADFFSHMFG
jgi:hypothetical protein